MKLAGTRGGGDVTVQLFLQLCLQSATRLNWSFGGPAMTPQVRTCFPPSPTPPLQILHNTRVSELLPEVE